MAKIHQLSVFVENKLGHLAVPCRILADAGLNMVALSLADTVSYGILRIIVRDWEKAKSVLERAGIVVKMTEVVAVEVPDAPGGLADLLSAMGERKINVEYMYAFTRRHGDKAMLIFRFEDPDAAVAALNAHGAGVLARIDLFGDDA